MKITRIPTILAATVATSGAIGIISAPIASAEDATTDTLGNQTKLVDGGNIQGWTISNLKASSDAIPYPVSGTLWEATATDEALQGTVIPIVSNLNARARSGQTYRALFQIATPQGVNPATLVQGQTTTGKVYFDVTGDSPDSVVYNAAGRDLLTWLQPPPPRQAETTWTPAPARSPATPAPAARPATPAPAATPATQAPAGTEVTPPASTEGTPLPTGSQGTPLPADSQGTPLPANPQGTPGTATPEAAPVPATPEGAPSPASIGKVPLPEGSQGTPFPAGEVMPGPATLEGTPHVPSVGEMPLPDGSEGTSLPAGSEGTYTPATTPTTTPVAPPPA